MKALDRILEDNLLDDGEHPGGGFCTFDVAAEPEEALSGPRTQGVALSP